MIHEIVDLTDFVKEQAAHIKARRLNELLVPEEAIYIPASIEVQRQIGL